jgi:AcrR family transcriptional regulator
MAPEKETKKRIMDAAFELFTNSSYDKVSINDIIEKAGVSKGGLFHYFDSKYVLARGTLFNAIEKIWNEPFEELNKINDPFDKMRRLVDLSVDITIKNPKMIKFFIDLHEETLKQNADEKIWLDFFMQYLDSIGMLFDQCRIPNPNMKAMLFLVSLDAVGFEAAHFTGMEKNLDPKMLKDEFYEIFVGNYEKLAKKAEKGD